MDAMTAPQNWSKIVVLEYLGAGTPWSPLANLRLQDRQENLQKITASSCCFVFHLLIGCELDCSLWGNFKNIDSVASPQRPQSSFFHHVLKTVQHVAAEHEGTMNLEEQSRRVITETCHTKVVNHEWLFYKIVIIPDRPVERLWDGPRGRFQFVIQIQPWLRPSAAATHTPTSSPLLKIHLGLWAAHLDPTSTEVMVAYKCDIWEK